MLFVLMWTAAAAAAAFGPPDPSPPQPAGPPAGHMISNFTCNKKAFYPTVAGGSGIRQLKLPQSMCSSVTDTDNVFEALCCANTHVLCSNTLQSPVLISYDGSKYDMPNDASKVLSAAYGRLCSMTMADKCGDCKRDTCSLFESNPQSKSCYGRTYTDKPDGSGFPKTKVGAVGTISSSCRPVEPIPTLNTTEYLRATWFIQQQQITGYQSKDSLFCVAQTFSDQDVPKVPFYDGEVIHVFNYATADRVNGVPTNTENETKLCARQPNPKDPARLINAPCFLPNFLAGDYWVVGAGPSPQRYDWAIVSAGTPTVQYSDGCTTKTTGVNGAGLWLFSRKPVANAADIATMRKMLVDKGYTLQELLPVPQEGCTYKGAYIKPDDAA